jgi:hypothetical protein
MVEVRACPSATVPESLPCGDSGTAGVTLLPSRSAVEGLGVFRRLRRRVECGHSTPERVLHGNFRLPCANLLKPEQLRKKSRRQVAVEQPEVNAGELVDS